MKILISTLKTLMILGIIFLNSNLIYSQYQERSYNVTCNQNSGTDFGRSIINRIDKGYAIAGYSYVPVCGIDPFDWLFVKIGSTGVHQTARLIGTQADDKCYSIIQTPNDSGYVLAGDMYQIPGQRAATLVKLSKTPNLLYSKKIDDTVSSNYLQVIRDGFNNWAFAGSNERPYMGIKVNKILATQYNPGGGMNWGFRYDSYLNANTFSRSKEEGISICFQPAGGPAYGIAAKTNRFAGNNGWDIMIVKTNYAGAVIWNKIYRFNMMVNPYPSAVPAKIIPMSDGGFTVVGTTKAFGNQNDIIVFRVNSAGNVIWSSTYGTTNSFEIGNSIVQDSAFFVVTGSRQVPGTNPNALLMKIPVTGGAPLWTKIWDNGNAGTEAGYDLVNSTTGAPNGYAITGETFRGPNSFDPFLWRTDDNGQVTGMNCQDSIVLPWIPNQHKLDSLILVCRPVKDTPFHPACVTPGMVTNTYCLSPVSSPTGSADENEVETGTELDNGIEEITSYSLKQNYPNPFNPTTKIQYEIPFAGEVSIKVFDLNGREVMTLVNESKPQGRFEVEFNGSNLSTGVYYYKITAGSFSDVKKMMLIK